MTRHRRSLTPRLEGLESRQVLASGVLSTTPALVHSLAVLHPAGTADGSFATTSPKNPDTGATTKVHAHGKFGGQHAEIRATVHLLGNVASGNAMGTATVETSKGKVYLSLVGPTQPGFSKLPGSFSYTITGGTKSFKNATGPGTIGVSLGHIHTETSHGKAEVEGSIKLTFS